MNDSKQIELIDQFKNLEAELIKLLNIEPINFDDSSKAIKTKIKAYIKKVEKAKAVFDEYEKVAEKIEKYTSKEGVDASSEILDMRKEREPEVIADELDKQEYFDKIEVKEGKQIVVKKKKKSSSVKEF